MQSFYPEFESGQVLTNAHLNQLGTWLNEQQQATRRKLLGIGIVCGLEATRAGNRVRVGRGVAVTSAGHLICREETHEHGRYRSYTLPVSGAVGDDGETLEQEVPPLLPVDDIPLWELLTDEVAPAPGEPAFSNLGTAFLADKVVMLLLETKRESLKNCDINDCSNKGARWVHTVRTLLLRESDAQTLWQTETAGSNVPRDPAWQALRSQLEPVAMPRLPLAASGAGSLEEIRQLAVAQVSTGWKHLRENLRAGFRTYGYLLRERFPDEHFPQDPWQDLNPVPPSQVQELADLLLDLHRYDLLQDAIASWHEFLEAACCFEALCCPDPQRFPFHVLLGKPLPAPVAEQPGDRRFGQIDFGIGAQPVPAHLRHPFYPAMQPARQHQLAADMLDLYYRTWLLFQRYRSDNLLETDLRLTPSCNRGPLSGKAIPYYLALSRNDDLHRNWHPHATRCGLLPQVQGYALHDQKRHPLGQVPDDSDFYRVEGLLGRPLGQVLANLRGQQQQLGIGFGIEPVFVPVHRLTDDNMRGQLLALLLRDQTLLRLFKCKLRDLDIIFLMLLGFIFQLLLALIYLLSRMGQATGNPNTPATGGRFHLNPALLAVNNAEISMALDSGNHAVFQAAMSRVNSNSMASFLQKQVRAGHLHAIDVMDTLDEPDDRNGPNADIYRQVKNQTSGDLWQRVRKVVGTQASEQQVQQAYYSMRMMEQTESLMQQSAVGSVAQFDFDRFDTDLTELQSAWKGYRAQPPAQSAPTTEPAVQAALDGNMNMLGNVSGSALMSNMRNEFLARVTKIFSEFMLDGYNRSFPGLEHRCGVPKGGTLVLAYTHRSLLQQAARGTIAAVSPTGNLALLQPAGNQGFTAATGGTRIVTNVAMSATGETVTADVAAVQAKAEAATALRLQREQELTAQEETLKVSSEELASVQRVVDSSRTEMEKLQLQRERMDQNTTASAAEKRAATLAVRETEARLNEETEKLTALQKQMATAEQQAKKAASALEEARKEEAAVREAAGQAASATASDGGASVGNGRGSLLSAARAGDVMAMAANRNFAAMLADDDPLNNLIVVADFCLPTYCCDSDCADLVPVPAAGEPPRDTPANPITISGRIVSSGFAMTHRQPSQLITDATLRVLDKQQQEEPVKMTRGSFIFKVNPGTYTLIASAPGFQTRQETVKLDVSPGQELVIELQRG